jgi:hypothetical protein
MSNDSESSSSSRMTGNRSKMNYNEEPFSASVKRLLSRLEAYTTGADLLQILKELYNIHPEYGRSAPVKTEAIAFETIIKVLDVSRLPLQSFTVSTLLNEIFSISKPPSDQRLISGRIFLVTVLLFQYQPVLQRIKDKTYWSATVQQFIDQLIWELEQDERVEYKSLLTLKGRSLLAKLTGEEQPGDYDNVLDTGNLVDSTNQKDALSRAALAKYLSKRLRHVYHKDLNHYGSFFMQIDGAWGSGKSTLLRFIKDELELEFKHDGALRFADQRWIVVNFNAWENQRLDPPWWFLMKSVNTTALKTLWKLNRRNYWRVLSSEYFFRINTGSNYFFAAVITLILFIVAMSVGIKDEKTWKNMPLVQLITFAGFLWSFSKFVRSSLVPGSAKAARSFIEDNGKDPMTVLANHFSRQIKNIGYPVAIFIDDLDRCNREYGISLLEGLQTIFKQAPVIYVVAADRRWLTTMYEKQYEIFAPIIAQPAKSFGRVFLDKTFQLILELPDISPAQKKQYWNSLLNVSNNGDNDITDDDMNEINKEIHNAKTNAEKLNLANNTGASSAKVQKIREEVIGSLSIKEEEKIIEHKLQKFVDLIEPNPRAMKRLINDISTAKAINYLYNKELDQDALILWTILKQQHPALAQYFLDNPAKIKDITTQTEPVSGIKELDDLLKKTEVQQLFDYSIDNKKVGIHEAFIRQLKYEAPQTEM